MPIYEIRSFTGLSDYEDRGFPGAFKLGVNLDVRKAIDSLSCQQALVDIGLHASQSPSASVSPSLSLSKSPSLSPSASVSPTPSPSASQSPSFSLSLTPSTTPSHSVSPSPSPSGGANVSTVFQDLVLWWVKATDGYTYGFGNTGYIYRVDADDFVQIVYKDSFGKIKGAAQAYSSNNKTWLVWATDIRLNIKPIPGRRDWNDVNTDLTGWPKQNLESTDWHTMGLVAGDIHIANAQFLAFLGFDLSYTNEALLLVPGDLAKTILERNGRSIIGTVPAAEPNRGVNGAIDAEAPLSQIGDDGEIFFADMTSTQPAKRFPGGGKVNPGGVCNEISQSSFYEWEIDSLNFIDKQTVGNMALWAVFNADDGRGGIYSYGRKNKNSPFVMNLEQQIDADELGAITNTNGKTMVSYRLGSNFGVKKVDPNNKAEAIYEGLDFRAPIKSVEAITQWKTAELFCDPLPTGTWLEFWYRINKNGAFIQANMEGGSTEFTLVNETKAVFHIADQGEIFEPRIVLHPSGNVSPQVHRVRINFE